jgi:hypothetical protein
MSLHRVALAVLATLFTAGISSAASANCCGWEAAAPVAYAPVAYASTGCGHCGTPTAAIVYAQPVMPAPVPVVTTWAAGCGCACGCRGLIGYATPGVEPIAVAPAPIYIVNQGPDYTGPGIMTPYHTWTPSASYVVPGTYPYAYGHHRYGYVHRHVYWRGGGYVGPRHVVYRGRAYGRPMMHRYR